MADLHIPKSCSYPKGWYHDKDQLDPPNIHDEDDLAFIVKEARHDLQGRHFNDKRGISMCVIGQIDEPEYFPPHNKKEREERNIPAWDTVQIDLKDYKKMLR